MKSARHPGFDAAHCPYGPPGNGVVVAGGMGARTGGGVGAGVKAGAVAMGVAISPSRFLVRPDKPYSNHSQQISPASPTRITESDTQRTKQNSELRPKLKSTEQKWISIFNSRGVRYFVGNGLAL